MQQLIASFEKVHSTGIDPEETLKPRYRNVCFQTQKHVKPLDRLMIHSYYLSVITAGLREAMGPRPT